MMATSGRQQTQVEDDDGEAQTTKIIKSNR